jgi:hypothetical protein
LKVIEASVNEFVKPRFIEGKPGGDEIDVKSRIAGGPDKLYNIGAGQRLPAGKINLKNSRFGCFAEHTRPNFGSKFAGATPQLKRI